ncbi:hypothetical protein [Acidocella sp.]|uniref:hypothetical protein n=1 Tax=Acidocella sp. TaxID=50710 RepID=UPI003D02C4DF
MSGSITDALKAAGLTDRQVDELTALQEQGRGIDFRYHFADDGSDPLRRGNQIDEFTARLRSFAVEGEVPLQFAASLWEHVTPRFVGWKPDFAEDVETRHIGYFHVRLDQEIDARLGRDMPQAVRAAALDVRERFDDLSFSYETGAWRDARTSGEVRDELLFVASLDEKIRGVLYGDNRVIDLTRETTDLGAVKSVGRDLALEPSFEGRTYQAQLTAVADILGRLRGAGIEIRTGLAAQQRPERETRAVAVQKDSTALARTRTAATASRDRREFAHRPAADATSYWRNISEQFPGASLSPTQGLTPAARRGRSI